MPRRCFDICLGKNNYMKLQIEKYQEDVLISAFHAFSKWRSI